MKRYPNILLIILIVFVSCNISNKDVGYIFKDNIVDLNPPDWILGTWEYAPFESVTMGFKFVSDDVLNYNPFSDSYASFRELYEGYNVTCKTELGELNTQCKLQHIVTDASSDSLYTVNIEKRWQHDSSYAGTTTFIFEKVSDNTIKYSETIVTKVIG